MCCCPNWLVWCRCHKITWWGMAIGMLAEMCACAAITHLWWAGSFGRFILSYFTQDCDSACVHDIHQDVTIGRYFFVILYGGTTITALLSALGYLASAYQLLYPHIVCSGVRLIGTTLFCCYLTPVTGGRGLLYIYNMLVIIVVSLVNLVAFFNACVGYALQLEVHQSREAAMAAEESPPPAPLSRRGSQSSSGNPFSGGDLSHPLLCESPERLGLGQDAPQSKKVNYGSHYGSHYGSQDLNDESPGVLVDLDGEEQNTDDDGHTDPKYGHRERDERKGVEGFVNIDMAEEDNTIFEKPKL